MLAPTHTPPPLTSRHAACWLCAIAALLALALGLHGPIPQSAGYHAFADARVWFGIPNAENVLSNLPFALIGLWAWSAQARCANPIRHVWRGFALALVCTAFGSALYHWAPGNAALVFDRLPIAWACALLSCAWLAERVDARSAGAPALTAAILTATASVAWWWLGERHGAGDLRPYLFVQFLPMLLLPALPLFKLPASSDHALRDRDWWAALGMYAVAKLMELADDTVFDAIGFISGHTLKHLLAAAAAMWLLRAALPLSSGNRR